MGSMRETLGGTYHAENKDKTSVDLLEDRIKIYERLEKGSRDCL